MKRAVVLALLALTLGACGEAGAPSGDSSDRLLSQAREALDRWDKAVAEAGGEQAFVPVGSLTGQVGTWEPDNGDNKAALAAGRVVTTGPLSEDAPGPTQVRWADGTTRAVTPVSAAEALRQISADAAADCGGCAPLRVTDARLTRGTVQTSRGPAEAPVWEFTVAGTAVRVTRVAVGRGEQVTVTPPSWDPYHAPGGISIETATGTTGGRQLTVRFTGAPNPKSEPCGADYSAEALESTAALVVIVRAHPHAVNETCASVGATRTATVQLAAPLGDRAVLEVMQGQPVPVTLTG